MTAPPPDPPEPAAPQAPSIATQDLSKDPLLLGIPRIPLNGKPVPALGGIPLLSRLGQGGMGAVFMGFHPRLKMRIAVKVLHQNFQQDAQSTQRFLREAQVAAQVRSEHLASVMDVDRDPKSGLRYIVMEFVHGRSGGKLIKEAVKKGEVGCDERTALDVCIAAAQGLVAAHAKGIVHRDIKPDNIMVPFDDATGVPNPSAAKLMDLGLARSEGSDLSLTASNIAVGTLGYMAPEQAMDAKSSGKPADVFSLGASLYALLSGKPPFTGETPTQAILMTLQQEPPPLSRWRPDVSSATQALVGRCLSKDPKARPQDGPAILAELQACWAGIGAATAPSPEPARARKPVTRAVPAPRAPLRHRAAAPARRQGIWVLGGIGAGLAIALFVGLVVMGPGRADPRAIVEQRLREAGEKSKNPATLDDAIALLDRTAVEFPAHAIRVEEALVEMRARKGRLAFRRKQLESLLSEADSLMSSDPDRALEKLAAAEKLGRPDADQGYPDLLSALSPSLAQRKARASEPRPAETATNPGEFEGRFQEACRSVGKGDWARAKALLAQAVNGLGRSEHARKAEAKAWQRDVDEQFVRDQALQSAWNEYVAAPSGPSLARFKEKARAVFPGNEDAVNRLLMRRKTNVEITKAPLEEALALFGRLGGVTLVADPSSVILPPTVDVRLADMSLEDALAWALKSVALDFDYRWGALFVYEPEGQTRWPPPPLIPLLDVQVSALERILTEGGPMSEEAVRQLGTPAVPHLLGQSRAGPDPQRADRLKRALQALGTDPDPLVTERPDVFKELQRLDSRGDFDFKEEPLPRVADHFQKALRVNVVLSADLRDREDTVTFKASDMRAGDALRWLAFLVDARFGAVAPSNVLLVPNELKVPAIPNLTFVPPAQPLPPVAPVVPPPAEPPPAATVSVSDLVKRKQLAHMSGFQHSSVVVSLTAGTDVTEESIAALEESYKALGCRSSVPASLRRRQKLDPAKIGEDISKHLATAHGPEVVHSFIVGFGLSSLMYLTLSVSMAPQNPFDHTQMDTVLNQTLTSAQEAKYPQEVFDGLEFLQKNKPRLKADKVASECSGKLMLLVANYFTPEGAATEFAKPPGRPKSGRTK